MHVCVAFVAAALCAAWMAPAQTAVQEADCTSVAPAPFAWSSGGAVVPGFVRSDRDTLQGVAISRWSAGTDLMRARRCGAVFAFVRLSAGAAIENELSYLNSWLRGRAARLEVGGYHALSLRLNDARIPASVESARAAGRSQARLFVDRLAEVRSAEIIEGFAASAGRTLAPMLSLSNLGLPGDVRQPPPVQEAVQTAVCGWMQEVRNLTRKPDLKFIVYGSLNQFVNLELHPCDKGSDTAWIALFTKDGAFPMGNPKLTAVCGPQMFNCRFHHYTSAGFLMSQRGGGPDLSRFFGTDAALRDLLVSIEGLERLGRSK